MSLQEVDSMEQLEQTINQEEELMVVFSKEQCPACDTMGRWLDSQFPQQNPHPKLKVVLAKLEKIGRDAVQDFSLRTVPTTLLFRQGDEVYRVPGFNNPNSLLHAVSTHL